MRHLILIAADPATAPLGAFITAAGILLYFLPAIVGWARQHPYLGAIVVVDLFLGWTLIGWVCALAWSLFPLDSLGALRPPETAFKPYGKPTISPPSHDNSDYNI